MPWGKFKGFELGEIASSYLVWVIENATSVSPTLREDIEHELGKRFAPPPPPPASAARRSCPDAELAADVIANGLGALAHRCHPDTGGTTRAMQQLNLVVEWLRQQVVPR